MNQQGSHFTEPVPENRNSFRGVCHKDYPSSGEIDKSGIQLLLPLCLKEKSKADLALVVHRLSNVYVATTVLSLDWAYSNARLIARPDTEWLDP